MVNMLLLLLLLGVSALPSNCRPASEGPRPPTQLRTGSRVVIVGAGPSGLHMAYLLRNLSFNNVLVLEASSRVGGRSVSLPDDRQPGVTHELGTCYLSSDYEDLRRMARGIGHELDAVPLPKAVVRMADGEQQSLDRFILDRVRRLDPSLGTFASDAEVAERIGLAALDYRKAREEFFPPGQPDYLEFPLSQPSAAKMSRLNCTLRQFLEVNNLMPLEPLFLLGMTAMGYGSADDTSALYGLMWMTPTYLGDLLSQRRNATGLSMIRRGFQSFWDAGRAYLERRGGVEFRFNSSVSRVTRSATSVRLELSDGTTETADWLVWTPGVHRTAAAGTFNPLTPAEATAFAGLSSRKFRTRLVRLSAEPGVAADPVAYYLDALDGPASLTRLLAVRNSAKVLQLPTTSSTLVAYYLSDYGDHTNGGGSPDVGGSSDGRLLDAGEILADATFDYMPRYSVSDMAAGAIWRLLEDVQAANRTWFAGHSVVFDSVKSVMKYNKMLLLREFPMLVDRLAVI